MRPPQNHYEYSIWDLMPPYLGTLDPLESRAPEASIVRVFGAGGLLHQQCSNPSRHFELQYKPQLAARSRNLFLDGS